MALGLLFLFLSGCAASFKGFPDQPINPEAEIAALSEYLMPDVAAKYASANPSDRGGLSREAWRNEVIDARLRAIDLRYNEWEQRLYQEQVETAFGTDLLLLGLTGAGAVSGASNVLSAAAAGVTGARASIDRNAYYNRTLPALIASMVAKRKQVLLSIRDGENKSADAYSLYAALNDVDSYYYAGTIPGALTDINVAAGTAVAVADEQLRERTFSFAQRDTTAQQLAGLLAGPGSSADRAKIETMRGCFPAAGVPPATLTFDFLNAPEFAEARRKVLACLQAALSTSPAGLQPAPAAPTPRTGRANAGPSSGTAGKPTRLSPTPATGTSLDPAGVALRALVSNKDGVVTSEGKARAVACYPADLPKTTNLIDVLREPSMATARQEIVKCLTES